MPNPDLNESGQLRPTLVLKLRDLLRNTFSAAALVELLMTLDRHAANYHGPTDDYPTMVRRIVEAANTELWWRDLVAAARKVRPTNRPLGEFAEKLDAAPIIEASTPEAREQVSDARLELLVRPEAAAFDIAVWRMQMAEIENRVCRVEYPAGTPRGTGFLVGPDVVITNYHVMQSVLEGTEQAGNVVLRFDHKVNPENGIGVGIGTACGLAADWNIDASPYSKFDLIGAPGDLQPGTDELDYALLRLERTLGNERLLDNDPASPQRGWIRVPPVSSIPDFTKQQALFIVQHPQGRPMKVTLDTQSIIAVVGNQTRLQYRTNTEHGSSGSPCFGADWQWLALHHSGDPQYKKAGDPARFNQGILVSAIVRLLKQRDKLGALGA